MSLLFLVIIVGFFSHCSWGSQGKNTEVHGMAHSFVELNKAVIHVIILVWFLCVCVCCCCCCCFSRGHGIVVLAFVCPLMDEDKRVVKAFCWEGLVVGKFESCFGGQGHAQ